MPHRNAQDRKIITITGMDWNNSLREVTLELAVWDRLLMWKINEPAAADWVHLQIRLFSHRNPDSKDLSRIITSIAFVEMAKPASLDNEPKLDRLRIDEKKINNQ